MSCWYSCGDIAHVNAYPDTMSLREARDLFFARSNLGPDGGYASRWVRVETNPLPFYFPITTSPRITKPTGRAKRKSRPGRSAVAAGTIMRRGFSIWAGGAPGSSSPREDCFAPSCAADRRKRICITLVLTKSISTKAQSAGCAINLDCTCRLHRQRCVTLRCSAFGQCSPLVRGARCPFSRSRFFG